MKELRAFDVDVHGNCIACGGVHFGTGRVCAYKQTFPQTAHPRKASIDEILYLSLKNLMDIAYVPLSDYGTEVLDSARKALALYESKHKP